MLGDAGNILLEAQVVALRGGSRVESTTVGSGRGGTITVRGLQGVTVSGISSDGESRSGVRAKALGSENNAGAAGDISLRGQLVTVQDGAQIDSSTTGPGRGGIIDVRAEDSMTISGPGTRVSSDTRNSNGSAGGSIELRIGEGGLTLLDGAAVTATTLGGGNAGEVNVTVEGPLMIDSGASVSTSTSGLGLGGSIVLDAGLIVLRGEGSGVVAQTLPTQADLAVELDIDHPFDADLVVRLFTPSGSRVALLSRVGGDGDGFVATRLDDRGTTAIENGVAPFTGIFRPREPLAQLVGHPLDGTWTLDIRDQQTGNTGTLEKWSLIAGQTRYTATDLPVAIPDSGTLQAPLLVQTDTPGAESVVAGAGGLTGDGGDISLRGGSLTIMDTASISVASVTMGQAGTISVSVDGPVMVMDNASVTASASQANAGDISITSGNTIELADGVISATAELSGGNIKLTAPDRVELNRGTLTARAGGDGARIVIDPRFVILRQSLIDGRAGGQPVEVVIDPSAVFLNSQSQILTTAASLPPELDIAASVVAVPVELLTDKVRLEEGCAVRFNEDDSSFMIQPDNGPPIEPSGWLPSYTHPD